MKKSLLIKQLLNIINEYQTAAKFSFSLEQIAKFLLDSSSQSSGITQLKRIVLDLEKIPDEELKENHPIFVEVFSCIKRWEDNETSTEASTKALHQLEQFLGVRKKDLKVLVSPTEKNVADLLRTARALCEILANIPITQKNLPLIQLVYANDIHAEYIAQKIKTSPTKFSANDLTTLYKDLKKTAPLSQPSQPSQHKTPEPEINGSSSQDIETTKDIFDMLKDFLSSLYENFPSSLHTELTNYIVDLKQFDINDSDLERYLPIITNLVLDNVSKNIFKIFLHELSIFEQDPSSKEEKFIGKDILKSLFDKIEIDPLYSKTSPDEHIREAYVAFCKEFISPFATWRRKIEHIKPHARYNLIDGKLTRPDEYQTYTYFNPDYKPDSENSIDKIEFNMPIKEIGKGSRLIEKKIIGLESADIPIVLPFHIRLELYSNGLISNKFFMSNLSPKEFGIYINKKTKLQKTYPFQPLEIPQAKTYPTSPQGTRFSIFSVSQKENSNKNENRVSPDPHDTETPRPRSKSLDKLS